MDSENDVFKTNLLPNFCNSTIILSSMLIGEALAITLTASRAWDEFALNFFAYSSLFIQWIILMNIGVLCWTKQWIERSPPKMAITIIFISFQVVTLIVSELAYQILAHIAPEFVESHLFHSRLVVSNLMISCVISLIVLSVFQLQHKSMQRHKAAATAKMQALQARIRPHFLFNSMNTIANLIHVKPDAAEDAILDLSELFRSSLGKHEFVSLNEEINITQRYISIEKLRLGDRLTVDWSLPTPTPTIDLPALILQPLVENAIYHGIEPIPDGGKIAVSVEKSDNTLKIIVDNPIPDFVPTNRKKGNQVAIQNIQDRLALIYKGEASMTTNKNKHNHRVVLSFPLNE